MTFPYQYTVRTNGLFVIFLLRNFKAGGKFAGEYLIIQYGPVNVKHIFIYTTRPYAFTSIYQFNMTRYLLGIIYSNNPALRNQYQRALNEYIDKVLNLH